MLDITDILTRTAEATNIVRGTATAVNEAREVLSESDGSRMDKAIQDLQAEVDRLHQSVSNKRDAASREGQPTT